MNFQIQLQNILLVNVSKGNLKEKKFRTRFEFLYENSSIHDKKLDLIGAKVIIISKKERTTPVINQKSKNLKRSKELFHKPLYKLDNDLIKKILAYLMNHQILKKKK